MSTLTLYEKHVKIRPRPVRGRFQRWRNRAIVLLLGIFHLLPLLQWNGRQAVLFDIGQRRFFVFGLNIWPQDFILLTFILLGLALVLFLFTALLGRVWCGYACPHTVYGEVFLWLEQKIEGNRSEQLRIARLPWNSPEKLRKRGLKYLAWLLVSFITGVGFVGYFTPLRPLLADLWHGSASPVALGWIAGYGGFCWLMAGLVREQFCKYICPYARFQGAMFDRHTLIIAYDGQRGEPRRRLKKIDRPGLKNPPEPAPARSAPPAAPADGRPLGYCVDCTMCVQVCPTGIDIRDGLQVECIACAACIDACDSMMDQIGAPHGLIRYTSAEGLAGRPTRWLRPKTLGYGLVLSLAFTLFVGLLVAKRDVALDVIADRNHLARPVQKGTRVQNVYLVKILNKSERERHFLLALDGLAGGEIERNRPLTVAPSQMLEKIISVNVPTATVAGHDHLSFSLVLSASDDPSRELLRQRTTFSGKRQP